MNFYEHLQTFTYVPKRSGAPTRGGLYIRQDKTRTAFHKNWNPLHLNLNSFLVKSQIDNPSPGAVTGGNHSLALTSEVNSDTLSSDSSEEEIKRLGEVIPVPESLGEEAMLKDIFTCLSNIYS